jgi:hypothetical protein
MESEVKTISNWAKKVDGKYLKQVVVITPNGKNKKGKKIYHSQTKHIPV